jgi:Ca2+-binding RTX toxin-like protein
MVTVALLLALVPSSARALELVADRTPDGYDFKVTDPAGQDNSVTWTPVIAANGKTEGFTISDTYDILDPIPGFCQRLSSTAVTCLPKIRVDYFMDLGSGNDGFKIFASTVSMRPQWPSPALVALNGGAGSDRVDVNMRQDPVHPFFKSGRWSGGPGNNYISVDTIGYRMPNVITAGNGADQLSGGKGPDKIISNGGTDFIYGQGGPDLLKAGQGNDHAYGGPGRDKIDCGPGKRDFVEGGPGVDIVSKTCETF